MISGRIERLIVAAVLVAGTVQAAVAAPVVVLDAGHGGERPGAQAGDISEKSVTLAVAKHARAALVRAGVKVIMTRDRDEHVKLSKRIERANKSGAAAFISIHANSAPTTKRRGCETYILSAQASDDISAGLLHQENDGETIAEARFGGGATGDVQAIVSDLSRGATHEASARLAERVQASLGTVPPLGPSRGLRQAPFLVLRGAEVPAALVEIGYLSHPVQAQALSTPAVQRAAGAALARGIIAFVQDKTAALR